MNNYSYISCESNNIAQNFQTVNICVDQVIPVVSTLYIVIPCYNEETVLPITAPMFLHKLEYLISIGKICEDSRIMFVDDGSKDQTWEQIRELSANNAHYCGIRLSRNRGHQNAVLAGMMESKRKCDITITIDCDGQDDIDAIDKMVDAYLQGYEVVYGVRSKRDTDSLFKRFTAESFYKIMTALGVECVFNHADYRLVSCKVLDAFSKFHEVNLFLRGMFPLVGFRSTTVYYERKERIAGESHYPFRKMLALAIEGITSLSVKPLHYITFLGLLIAMFSFAGVIWSFWVAMTGMPAPGWASMTCIICLVSGVQLISIGVLGEYIGKIYLEVKQRPTYIISERTFYVPE